MLLCADCLRACVTVRGLWSGFVISNWYSEFGCRRTKMTTPSSVQLFSVRPQLRHLEGKKWRKHDHRVNLMSHEQSCAISVTSGQRGPQLDFMNCYLTTVLSSACFYMWSTELQLPACGHSDALGQISTWYLWEAHPGFYLFLRCDVNYKTHGHKSCTQIGPCPLIVT